MREREWDFSKDYKNELQLDDDRKKNVEKIKRGICMMNPPPLSEVNQALKLFLFDDPPFSHVFHIHICFAISI